MDKPIGSTFRSLINRAKAKLGRVELEFGVATHAGRRRSVNEDTCHADGDLGLWLIADGMGGAACGDVASRIARDVVARRTAEGLELTKAIVHADRAIRAQARVNQAQEGMGTTIAALRWIRPGSVQIAWVGDSRIYRIGRTIRQLSQDDSVLRWWLESGALTPAEALVHPMRGVLTDALGAPRRAALKVSTDRLISRGSDRFMLCSDGLTDELSNDEILAIAHQLATSPQQCAQTLVDRAVAAGGRDNVSAIIVQRR